MPYKNITTEELHKEIDLIQNCISRMAKKSFLLKGWAISVVLAVFAISSERINSLLILSVIIGWICFWILDAFFLQAERKYRKLYSWVLVERGKNNKDKQYDLNLDRFKKEVNCLVVIMFSKTLAIFYGIPIILGTICVLIKFI